MQIKFSVYDFYIFFIDKPVLYLRICRYSLGKLMTEVLKMVKKSIRDGRLFYIGGGVLPFS